MNGLTVTLTAAEWQRCHDELLDLLASRSSQSDHRVAELRALFARAVPDASEAIEPDRVGLGSRVTVRWDDGQVETYQVVAPDTAVLDDDVISYRAPVGQAVFGRRAGDRVAVATPLGPSPIEIVAVAPPAPSANQAEPAGEYAVAR